MEYVNVYREGKIKKMLSRMRNREVTNRILAFVLFMMLSMALSSVNSVKAYAYCNSCEHCGESGYVCCMHDNDMLYGLDSGETCYSACNGQSFGDMCTGKY